MCKHGDMFSLPVLIGRGLDQVFIGLYLLFYPSSSLFSFQSISLVRKSNTWAPLAQLVEQLTLNQRVLGSSPWWCTTTFFGANIHSR